MPFLQYAAWNAYACCSLWPFWSRLSIWIYQLLTEICPEIIMIWWKKEQVLPFYQSNLIFAYLLKILYIIKLSIELFLLIGQIIATKYSSIFLNAFNFYSCFSVESLPCFFRICVFKLFDWLDRWSQNGQAYGFTPVCVLRCLFMLMLDTILEQIEHLDLPIPTWRLTWKNYNLMGKTSNFLNIIA